MKPTILTTLLICALTQAFSQTSGFQISVENPKNTFALIVGNEDYQAYNENFTSNVSNAVLDAEKFENILVNQYQVPPQNITMVPNATQTHLKLALTKFQTLAKTRKAFVIVYFNGKIIRDSFSNLYLLNIDDDPEQVIFALQLKDVISRIESWGGKGSIFIDALVNNEPKTGILEDGGTHSAESTPNVNVYFAHKVVPEKEKIITPEAKIKLVQITDNSPPEIYITSPQISKIENITTANSIYIEGKAEDDNGIYLVAVNGEEAHLAKDGYFRARVLLKVGFNDIHIEAFDLKNNRAESRFRIKREELIEKEDQSTDPALQLQASNISRTQGSGTKTVEAVRTINPSVYYAFIVAVNEYQSPSMTNLSEPLNDAEKLYNTLVNFYGFNPENVFFLKNPTREEVIQGFDQLEKTVSSNDNLLIFYAGHGYWDKITEKGYWLPADANLNNTANWIRNSTISGYISGIKSKHTLLIADACFSGGIFKTRSLSTETMESHAAGKLYLLPSRKAMTSGTLQEVPDKSVFVQYLVNRLESNTESFLTAEQLFFTIKPAVLNNSENIPQYGVIKNTGDEGGDFVFYRSPQKN